MEELFTFLEIDENLRTKFLPHPSFPLNLPRRLAEKIQKNDLQDPLLRQFVPLAEEEAEVEGFEIDPLHELSFKKAGKLLSKYRGRSLLITTNHCVMNCRFCFRRHFPYEKKERGWDKELAQLQADTTLQEVILSGGDPLSLNDNALETLLDALNAIPHLQRLRFHTRFPLGIPERISPAFLALLERSKKQILFVLHINHPRELDIELFSYLKKLQRLGIPLLSQSVLLKGVNDSFNVLHELYETLTNQGILPYYLHDLDKVAGTAHFAVDLLKGKKLIEKLMASTSGYAIPRYVQEIPGQPHKTPL
jgi:EF-P beta-lysylation protein EpmB